MKKPSFIIVLFLAVTPLFAQDPSSGPLTARLSAGPGFINSRAGLALENSLDISLHRLFSVELYITFGNSTGGDLDRYYRYEGPGSPGRSAELSHETLYSGGIVLYVTPVKNTRHTLAIGPGYGYNYLVSTMTSINSLSDPATFRMGTVTNGVTGLKYSIKYSYCLKNNVCLGIEGQRLTFGSAMESVMISLGYHFPARP